ncbi:MAG TPA: hypothetical protein VHE33_06020 [Acidobacteriaceae bacterium]|nr:hypothetical protein [Acidobacteriaceae bacterium]
MPLDARKIAHIRAAVQRTWIGRQTTVVFVSNAGGTYSYTAQSVIWKPQQVIDPQIPNVSGAPPGIPADVVMIVPLTTSLIGVVFVAFTNTATSGAVAAAQKFELIEAVPTGILPGGTHYTVALRRFR